MNCPECGSPSSPRPGDRLFVVDNETNDPVTEVVLVVCSVKPKHIYYLPI